MPKMPFFAVWAGQMGGGAFLFLPMPWPVPGRRSVTRTAPLFKWGVSPTPFLDPTCPYIQPWLPPCEVVIHTGMVVIGLSCCCNSYSIGPALCSMICQVPISWWGGVCLCVREVRCVLSTECRAVLHICGYSTLFSGLDRVLPASGRGRRGLCPARWGGQHPGVPRLHGRRSGLQLWLGAPFLSAPLPRPQSNTVVGLGRCLMGSTHCGGSVRGICTTCHACTTWMPANRGFSQAPLREAGSVSRTRDPAGWKKVRSGSPLGGG